MFGIAQSATKGETLKVKLADEDVNLAGPFMEFVWRYPKKEIIQPKKWGNFFTGFIAQNANCVIESVYTTNS